ncbi:MAG: deoxyribodipyrimidine photo-lyase, partial [Gammaproteobacteria bacterium]
MNGLVWLRSDLRIDDNPALSMASIECKKLFCVYLLADQEWKTHNNANVKLDFILRNLKYLSEDLQELNIPLVSAYAISFNEIPNIISELCSKNNIKKCYWNNEFGVDEGKRDKNVESSLKSSGIEYQSFDDQTFFKPGALLTGQGNPFSVFTPFKKKWIENFSLDYLEIGSDISKKEPFKVINTFSKEISFKKTHFVDMGLW